MQLQKILLGLLLVLLPSQLGLHLWPGWAHVLGRRVDYLSPTLYLTDVLILGLVLLEIIQKYKRWKMGKRGKNHGLIWVGLLGFAMVNIYFSLSPALTVYKWLKLVEFLWLGRFVVSFRPRLAWVFQLLSVSTVWSTILALLQLWQQGSLGGIWWWLGERAFDVDSPGVARTAQLALRAYATFPHPNTLGAYLGLVSAGVLAVALTGPKKLIGWWWGVFIFVYMGVLATFSRSAIAVSTSINLLIFIFCGLKRGIGKLAVGVVLGLGVLASVYAGLPTLTDESLVVRGRLVEAAIAMWQSHFWSGVGLGNFLVALPHYLSERGVYFLQPVHNIYLLWATETGFVGLILAVIAGWRYITALRKLWSNPGLSKQKIFRLVTLFVIIGMLVLGAIDHYFLSLQQGQLFLTILLALPFLL